MGANVDVQTERGVEERHGIDDDVDALKSIIKISVSNSILGTT